MPNPYEPHGDPRQNPRESGQPYGQPPQPYGQPYSQVKRPVQVTAAAVIAFILAALQAFGTLLSFGFVGMAGAFVGSGGQAILMVMAVLGLPVAGGMILGGIQALKGKTSKTLIVSAAAGVVLRALGLIVLISNSLSDGLGWAVLGLVLQAAVVVILLQPPSKQYFTGTGSQTLALPGDRRQHRSFPADAAPIAGPRAPSGVTTARTNTPTGDRRILTPFRAIALVVLIVVAAAIAQAAVHSSVIDGVRQTVFAWQDSWNHADQAKRISLTCAKNQATAKADGPIIPGSSGSGTTLINFGEVAISPTFDTAYLHGRIVDLSAGQANVEMDSGFELVKESGQWRMCDWGSQVVERNRTVILGWKLAGSPS